MASRSISKNTLRSRTSQRDIRRPVKPDPIFAAIARNRAAEVDYQKARAAERKFRDHSAARNPKVTVGTATVCNNPRDVHEAVENALIDAKHRFETKLAARLERPLEAVGKTLLKAYWDDSAALQRARKRAGIAAVRKRWGDAVQDCENTQRWLFMTKPRTLAGAVALAERAQWLYREERSDSGMTTRWEAEKVLAGVAAAVQHLKKRSAS